MFVDTSVIVAILAEESDASELGDRMGAASRRVTSGLVILEAAMRLATLLLVDPHDALAAIMKLIRELNIEVIAIGEAEAFVAVEAFATYGKGRGHPARLNLADCMSYACAQTTALPLLYEGRDFAQTDLA